MAEKFKKVSKEEFIERANKIYNGKYDYSELGFTDMQSPITIICPHHGETSIQEAKAHIRGADTQVHCRSCKYIDNKVAAIPEHVHEKYTVETHLNNYYNCKITCKIHTTETKELKLKTLTLFTEDTSISCKECIKEYKEALKSAIPKKPKVKRISKNQKTLEDFIRTSEEKWGVGVFDFTNTVYRGSKKSISFKCNTCNTRLSNKKPYEHLKDDFCCYGCNRIKKNEQFVKDFEKLSNEKYNSKYDYSLLPDIFRRHDKLKIICPLHGEFIQSANNHLYTATFGCQTCGAENSSGFSRTDYIAACDGRKPIVYLVEMSLGDELFYKIGITVSNVDKRFKGSRTPYDHKLLDSIRGEASLIYDLEKDLHYELKSHKYKPTVFFQGSTECFIPCKEVIDKFKTYKLKHTI